MRNTFILFCLICLVGCTNQPKAPTDSILPVLDLTKDYPEMDIDLQEIADVEYIPLETTEKSIAAYFLNPHISEKYIVTRDAHGPVQVYDRKGKFLHSVNKRGKGPHEYYTISSLAVDFEREELYIWDSEKIQVYSLTGEWKRRLPTDENMFYKNFYSYDKNHLIFENTFNDGWNAQKLPADKTPYYLINKETGELTPLNLTIENRISKTLERRVEDIDEHHARPRILQIYNIFAVMANSNDFLIADFGLDTIYSYKDLKLTPLAIKYPPVHSRKPPIVLAPRVYSEQYLFFKPVKMTLNEDHPGEPYLIAPTLMWDRKDNKIYKVNIWDSEYTGKGFISHAMDDKWIEEPNCFLMIHWASKLREFYEAGKLKGKLKEVAAKLKEDDNDVVVIYKLKQKQL